MGQCLRFKGGNKPEVVSKSWYTAEILQSAVPEESFAKRTDNHGCFHTLKIIKKFILNLTSI